MFNHDTAQTVMPKQLTCSKRKGKGVRVRVNLQEGINTSVHPDAWLQSTVLKYFASTDISMFEQLFSIFLKQD